MGEQTPQLISSSYTRTSIFPLFHLVIESSPQTAIMADVEPANHERKPRKSVAFSEGTTIVDENGAVTMADGHDDTKDTAQSHSPSTPPLSQALGAFADPVQGADGGANEPTNDDDVANMLKGMKKKKSKKPKAEDADAEGGEAAAEDGGLDLSSMKQKNQRTAKEEDDRNV